MGNIFGREISISIETAIHCAWAIVDDYNTMSHQGRNNVTNFQRVARILADLEMPEKIEDLQLTKRFRHEQADFLDRLLHAATCGRI